MFFGFKSLLNMIFSSDIKINYVIRFRYDTIVDNIKNNNVFKKFIENNRTGIITTKFTAYGGIMGKSMSDQFAIGDLNSMLVYFNSIDNIDRYYDDIKIFGPETFLCYSLIRNNINFELSRDFGTSIVRTTCKIYDDYKNGKIDINVFK